MFFTMQKPCVTCRLKLHACSYVVQAEAIEFIHVAYNTAHPKLGQEWFWHDVLKLLTDQPTIQKQKSYQLVIVSNLSCLEWVMGNRGSNHFFFFFY